MELGTERLTRLWGLVRPHVSATDIAHDADHVLRVYRWATRLAPEAGADQELAGAAALVHDLEPVPKESPDRALGGERAAVAALPMLERAGFSAAEIAEIQAAVRTSSWSRGLAPAGPTGAVLQDADRLDAIGAIGVARVFATAQGMVDRGADGRLWDPDDPFAATGRPLDDRRQALDHFARKLNRLAAGMHTSTARAEAGLRHEAMLRYLDALARELGARSA